MVKRWFCFLVVFCAFSSSFSADREIKIVTALKDSEPILSKLSAFVQDTFNSGVKAELLDSNPLTLNSSSNLVFNGNSSFTTNNLYILLVDITNRNNIAFINITNNISAVNIGVLLKNGEKKYGRNHLWRIEKEVVYAGGHLLGMPDCPLFQCAQYRAMNINDVDIKSRNFCPVCMTAVQKRLKKQGFELIAK